MWCLGFLPHWYCWYFKCIINGLLALRVCGDSGNVWWQGMIVFDICLIQHAMVFLVEFKEFQGLMVKLNFVHFRLSKGSIKFIFSLVKSMIYIIISWSMYTTLIFEFYFIFFAHKDVTICDWVLRSQFIWP